MPEWWSLSACSYGAQERLLPTIAAAVSDPVGQSSQRGTAAVGSDAAVDEPPVLVLPAAIPPPDGAVAVAAVALVPGVAATPMVGVARIADDDVGVAELENVGAGMFVPVTPKLVDVAAGGAVVVELEDIDELENIALGMFVVGVSDGCAAIPGMFVVGASDSCGA